MGNVGHYKFWLFIVLGVPLAIVVAFSSLLVSQKESVAAEMKNLDGASHFTSEAGDLVHEIQKERGYTAGYIAALNGTERNPDAASHFASKAGGLVHELQKERGYTAGYLGSLGTRFKDDMLKQRGVTDKQYARFLESLADLKRAEGFYKIIGADLEAVLKELLLLKDKRAAVDSDSLNFLEVARYYTDLNTRLLDFLIFVPRMSADTEITSSYLAAYYLEQAKEKAGIQRAVLTYVFSLNKFPPGIYDKFLDVVKDGQHARSLFNSFASPSMKKSFAEAMEAPEVKQADALRSMAIERGIKGDFGVDAELWYILQTKKMDGINRVSELLEKESRKLVDDRLAEANSSVRNYTLINIFIIAFVGSVIIFLFHSISKRKEAEDQLEHHAKRMEGALLRAKDVLDSIAIHPRIIPYFTVSPAYRSMRSMGGGDSVKWLWFRSRYSAIYLHDVAGHDIEEMLLNILATAIVDIYKENPSKKSASVPSLFLARLNEHLVKYCEGTTDYLTAVYALMDFEFREIRIASAGHPWPMLIRPDGTVRKVTMPPGFILGQFDIKPLGNEPYADVSLRMEPGELLLFYSDGLMEQPCDKGETFEQKFVGDIGPRLAGLEPRTAHDLLKAEFESILGDRIPMDDVSFVFIGTRPNDKYETRRFTPSRRLISEIIDQNRLLRDNTRTPDDSEGASAANLEPSGNEVTDHIFKQYDPLLEKLRVAGWSENKVADVKLAVHEMILNAIMHGNGCSDKFFVEMTHVLHDDLLEVCVSDMGEGFDGNSLPQQINEFLLRNSGRGHLMIDAVADGVYFNDSGNRCWALFRKESPQGEATEGGDF